LFGNTLSPKSADHGTLYHIRNVLRQSDVGKPKRNMNSCVAKREIERQRERKKGVA
uniref:Uncharacterized protein n=1 Tax=Amphimedon queenslandica TaxID=400682 RepID=A0A1X7UWZ7_AMPQE